MIHVSGTAGPDPARRPSDATPTERPAEVATPRTTSPADRIELSPTARDLPRLQDILREANEDRVKRIAELKAQLAEGKFDREEAFVAAARGLRGEPVEPEPAPPEPTTSETPPPEKSTN